MELAGDSMHGELNEEPPVGVVVDVDMLSRFFLSKEWKWAREQLFVGKELL